VAAPERVPPHNLEAEQSLLGSMFLSMEAIEAAIEKVVAPEDFYRSAHGRIFDAVQHLFNRGEPVDVISVADRLEATGELEQVGGKLYLLDVTNAVPSAANARYYAEIVKRASLLRQLIDAANSIANLGYDSTDDVDEVVEQAEKYVFAVTGKRVETRFTALKELIGIGWKQLEALYERQTHTTGVPTGFPEIDEILSGLHRGNLIILAARPSVGKTAFALNVAVNAAMEGHPVAVFSLEMAAEELVQRVICAEARIDMQRMRTGHLNEGDWKQINRAAGTLSDLPLYVDDTPAMSILQVRAKARRLLHNRPNGLVVIDYLQLMQPHGRRSENRQVEIADISRGLKILAKELDVPILALSQLSRAVEQRAGKRPQLSDLRESGAIEQDADVVMFIHRDVTGRGADEDAEAETDKYGNKGSGAKYPPKGEAEVIVGKQRNGPLGSANVVFLDKFTKFVPLAKRV